MTPAKDNGSIKISESDIQPLYQLNKVLEQESHNLRSPANESFTDNGDKSIRFAQCLHIRSVDLNYMLVADKSREFLSQSKKPFLDIRWAKVHNKEALIRTLEGHSTYVNSVAITSDNTKIVSGSSDSTMVWDMNSLKSYLSYKFDSFISSISLSKSQNLVALGDSSGDLYMGFLFA